MPTRYWHPFADMHKVQDHELVLVRGAGAWIEDADGRRYLDATAGLWYCNVGPRPDGDRRRRRPAALDAGRLLELRRLRDGADPRAGRPAGGAGPDGGRLGLLRLGRLGRRGHRRQAGPPLLGRARAHREADRRQPRARLPRHARLRDGPGRDPGDAGGLRRPDRRRHDPGLRARRRGAGAALQGPRQGDRRLHRRAGDRRRRRDPARGRLLGGGHPALRRPRRPARRRRGHHRLRPPRHDVRQRALRDRARHDLLRQGRHVRATCRSAACSSGAAWPEPFWDGAVGADLPPRLHLLGARDGLRRGPRQPRHPRARGPGRPGAGAGAGARARDRPPRRRAARRRDPGGRAHRRRRAGRRRRWPRTRARRRWWPPRCAATGS